MKKLNKKDLTGQIFGDRVVIKRTPAPEHIKNKKRSFWLVKCKCGNEDIKEGGHLRQGTSDRCRSCSSIPLRKEKGECSFNGLYLLHKHRDSSKKFGFTLSKEQFKILTKGNCYYCNTPPNNEHKGVTAYGSYIYNGIDRLDSNKGYHLENCVSCCEFCNRAKNNASLAQFKEWIKRLVEFNKE